VCVCVCVCVCACVCVCGGSGGGGGGEHVATRSICSRHIDDNRSWQTKPVRSSLWTDRRTQSRSELIRLAIASNSPMQTGRTELIGRHTDSCNARGTELIAHSALGSAQRRLDCCLQVPPLRTSASAHSVSDRRCEALTIVHTR
jgi:hypothetical protein